MTVPVLVNERAELGRVLVRGARLQAGVQELVTAASVGWSTTEVTQMSLTVEDPGFQLWHSGLFALHTTVTYRPTSFREDLRLRIAAFDLGGGSSGRGGFTIKARSEIAWLLKRRRGPLVMPGVSASGFIIAEARAVSARVVAQPTITRAQIARDVPESGSDARGADAPSSWTTFSRLADEEGFLIYEFAGTVYFGKPSWLMANLGGGLNVGWATPNEDWNAMKCPSISLSDDAETPVSISGIEVRPHRIIETAPGRRLIFHGIHHFVGTYLTTSLTLPMMGTGNLQLACETPFDAPPQPPSGQLGQTASTVSTAAAVPGGKTAQAFVSMALSQTGKRYAYGAEAAAGEANPSAFDCSELIQWALSRIGVFLPDGSAAQINATQPISVADGLRTRGALLYQPGHIGISLGDGRSVEARNSRSGVGVFPAADIKWTRAGRIKGLQY